MSQLDKFYHNLKPKSGKNIITLNVTELMVIGEKGEFLVE